jgi:Lon protease-like protein
MTGLFGSTSFEQLPRAIPVFPLAGVLLLPGGRLPLNIFEPRYLTMTQDALAAPERLIGMIQPQDPASPLHEPPIWPVGCAGRISSFAETDDGRFLITLSGVCRFRVARELDGVRGYRRVEADWSGFAADMTDAMVPSGALDRGRLAGALKAYFRQNGIDANWEAIERTPDDRLVTSLAMICPFGPREKQALLEAPDLTDRAKMLLALIEMAVHEGGGGGDGEPAARH